MMRDRSVRCALWMKAHGLSPGDVVIICTHNHLDHAMPCYAALYLGAIFNPLDVGLHAGWFFDAIIVQWTGISDNVTLVIEIFAHINHSSQKMKIIMCPEIMELESIEFRVA